MFIVGLLEWWYGPGWRQRLEFMNENLSSMLDYFSFGLLARTLFSPFRQISAGGPVQGPLGVKFRAMLDNLVSRIIGAVLRMVIMVVGGITLFLSLIANLLFVGLWAAIPVLPLAGLILAIINWIPWGN